MCTVLPPASAKLWERMIGIRFLTQVLMVCAMRKAMLGMGMLASGMLGCRDVGNGVEQEKSWEVMRRGRLRVGVCL